MDPTSISSQEKLSPDLKHKWFSGYFECLSRVAVRVRDLEAYIKENDKYLSENSSLRVKFKQLKDRFTTMQQKKTWWRSSLSEMLTSYSRRKVVRLEMEVTDLEAYIRDVVGTTRFVVYEMLQAEAKKREEINRSRNPGLAVELVEKDGRISKAIVERVAWEFYGSFGQIYLGRHDVYGRLAFKRHRTEVQFKNPGQHTPEDWERRFLREEDIWKSLNHPNILPYLGRCTFENVVLLVSPFIEDADLVKFAWQAPERTLLKILIGISSGLAYLHDQNIFHGDVRAGNILVDQNAHIYICDFGLARDQDQLSLGSAAFGTELFCSPERRARQRAPGSFKDDVYAFGITIAQIMRGGDAYDGLDQWGVPPVGDGPIWLVAARCWEKDAEKRPTMKTVRDEFIRMAQDLDTSDHTGL